MSTLWFIYWIRVTASSVLSLVVLGITEGEESVSEIINTGNRNLITKALLVFQLLITDIIIA